MNKTFSHEPAQIQPPVWMEDEIDLREYIVVLINHWQVIAVVTILSAVVAFVASSVLPKTYEATASAVILRSRTEVSFDPKIQTITEDQFGQKGYQDTFVALVSSPDVASSVLETMGQSLSEEQRSVASLLEKIEGNNTGDIISVTITDRDPTLAAKLANTWMRAYVDYVNLLYGGKTDSLLQEVQGQAQSTQDNYQAAQAAVEEFLATNQIDFLQREINVKKAQVASLRERGSVSESAPVRLETWRYDTLQKQIQAKYGRQANLVAWLTDAKAIRARLSSASESGASRAGESLAFLLLQRKALASSANTQEQLQLSLADFSEMNVSLDDVDAFIATLQSQQESLSDEIQQLADELLAMNTDITLSSPSNALTTYLDSLDAEIASLQSRLEAERAQKRELEQTRNLAWENYTTIQRKLAEVELSNQFTDSQIRLAASAIEPTDPVSPKRMMNTAVAGVLGLMLSVFAVFAWEYWRSGSDEADEKE